jgi:hypothetical protein
MTQPLGIRFAKLTSRIPNNVNHRHKLSISARMAAVSAELSWSESRHESSCAATAFDSAVAICGVGSDELVGVAAELHAGLADEVQKGEFIVYWTI